MTKAVCTYCMLFLFQFLQVLIAEEGLISCSPFVDTTNKRLVAAIGTWMNYVNSSPD